MYFNKVENDLYILDIFFFNRKVDFNRQKFPRNKSLKSAFFHVRFLQKLFFLEALSALKMIKYLRSRNT